MSVLQYLDLVVGMIAIVGCMLLLASGEREYGSFKEYLDCCCG